MEPRKPHIRSHEGIVEDQLAGIDALLRQILERLDRLVEVSNSERQQ